MLDQVGSTECDAARGVEALQLQAISTTALYLFMVHAQTNANREYQDVARRRSSTLSYKEQIIAPSKGKSVGYSLRRLLPVAILSEPY